MPTPGEHKTVQARILRYAQDLGWLFVSRAEAEVRRGFDSSGATAEERARNASLFFSDLLYAQVRAFNPKYKEAEGALVGEFARLHADITGNREFLSFLRNQGKFHCAEDNRELDLNVIDYGDLPRPRGEWRNVYEVTEEFYVNNGHYGTRRKSCSSLMAFPCLPSSARMPTKTKRLRSALIRSADTTGKHRRSWCRK